MKALAVLSPRPAEERPLELLDLPVPEPEAGEVRLRVLCCGVCRTDLHVAEGDLPPLRPVVVPGHQVVGVVDAVGEGVTRFGGGERVGVTWLHSACGRCECCRAGQENLCDDARFTGYSENGGFAEYCTIPAEYAHPLPPGIPDLQAAPLLCAGVIGYRSLRLCDIRPKGRLGLFGFGASAHVAIQVARHWGCQVYAFSRSEAHRAHALSLGAEWAGRAADAPPSPLDSAIIFAPAGEVVPTALRVLRPGGTLAINAVHMTPIPEIPYDLLWRERTLRTVANVTRRDAEEFLPLAARIPVRTDVETFPLEEANDVLLRLKRSQVRGAAVLRVGA